MGEEKGVLARLASELEDELPAYRRYKTNKASLVKRTLEFNERGQRLTSRLEQLKRRKFSEPPSNSASSSSFSSSSSSSSSSSLEKETKENERLKLELG